MQPTSTGVTSEVPSAMPSPAKVAAPPQQTSNHYEEDWEVFDPFYFIKHLPPLTKEQRCRQPGGRVGILFCDVLSVSAFLDYFSI